MVKTGMDIESEPDNLEQVMMQDTPSETPFDKGFDALMSVEGKNLEIMTRTNNQMVKASSITLAYRKRHPNMSFLSELMESTQRQAVGFAGKGRNEIVCTVQAGAGVPPSYYAGQQSAEEKRPTFTPVETE